MVGFWDADISALNLTPEEKNGLQVFRNYSAAFDRRRAAQFIENLDAQPIDISDLERVVGHVLNEESRMLPVIACAFADETLLAMLKREIPGGVPGGKESLLSGFGPLGRLSSRIQICYAFGWLSQDLLRDLNALRKIRNDISHKWDILAVQERINQFVAASEHPVETAFDGTGHAPDGLYKELDLTGRLRLQLIWSLGRLSYECFAWVPAVKSNLVPHQALYLQNKPKLLIAMADVCMKASRQLVISS